MRTGPGPRTTRGSSFSGIVGHFRAFQDAHRAAVVGRVRAARGERRHHGRAARGRHVGDGVTGEERAEEVKHHLWVLWTDYFKPEHLEKYPNLHDLFWNATKKAGEAKKTEDPAVGEELLALIDEIDKIFVDSKS